MRPMKCEELLHFGLMMNLNMVKFGELVGGMGTCNRECCQRGKYQCLCSTMIPHLKAIARGLQLLHCALEKPTCFSKQDQVRGGCLPRQIWFKPSVTVSKLDLGRDS